MSGKPRLIDRECAACDAPFQARATDVRRGLGRACSPRCSGRLGGRPKTKASHPSEKCSHPIQGTVGKEAHGQA